MYYNLYCFILATGGNQSKPKEIDLKTMLQTYKKNHRSVYVYLSESEKIIRSLRSYLGSGQLATEAAFWKADALLSVYTKIPDQSSRTIVGNFLVDVNLPELLTDVVRALQRSHPEAFSLQRLEASSTGGERRKKASKMYMADQRQQKRATCFGLLLQNQLKSDVAHFTTHESNLSWNKSACCKVRKFVAENRE